MNDMTIFATIGSVAHWECNRDAESWADVGVHSNSCPLCAVYCTDIDDFELGCNGCPVAKATGEEYCCGSPWLAARDAYGARRAALRIGSGVIIPRYDTDWRDVCDTEIDFLIALLPKGMFFENQAKLGNKPNWKIIPAKVDKYPSFATFCDECGCPFRDGKPGCYCSA